MVASPLATRLDGEGRQYVSGNLIIAYLLFNSSKMNLRTSKRRRSAQLVQGAPGNRVIGLALTNEWFVDSHPKNWQDLDR